MSTEVAGPPARRQGFRVVTGGLPLGAVLGAVAVVGGLAVSLLRLDRLGITLCTFKAMTGLPCMTCGGTRTAGLLARGDLAGALAMNPLVAVGFIALVPWALVDFFLWTRGRSLSLDLGPRTRRVGMALLLSAVVVNWAYLILAGR